MRPIRATLNYKVEVPYDHTNPLHAKYAGFNTAMEERSVHGVVTDILPLEDTNVAKVLDGTKEDKKGTKYNSYRDEIMSMTGVYVVFWEDMGDHHRMRIEDSNNITTYHMREYLKYYAT